jgi:hypothetical protein
MVELVVALVLLAAALVATAQIVSLATNQRREISRRQLATLEAANVLEHVVGRAWEGLNNEQLAEFALSERARQTLPGARLNVEISDVPGPPQAKRIAVEVSWEAHGPDAVASARLVAWKHRAAETQP